MLLERLRTETRPSHTSLESVVGLAGSVDHHLALLRGFHGFIRPWETAVLRSPHAALLAGREKAPLLAADLEHFGLSPADIDALPLCEELPGTDTLPDVLGSLYVIEGSTLGGQMISRHLESTLGLRDGRGYRYFQSYGAAVPARWNDFKKNLLAHSSPDNDGRIIASAANTFELLHRWFSLVQSPAR
jgi:heme oxygenase (biliverdin-IX-beta and delta-forming)